MSFTGLAGTLIGPLTTTWTMPSSCSVLVLASATANVAFRGQQCEVISGTPVPADDTACWPPVVTAPPAAPSPPFLGWGFYSPGLACPAGYTSACTAQYGGASEWAVEFALRPGETAVGCCPEGFHCTNTNGNTCVALATTGTQISVTTGRCVTTGLASVSLATFPDVITVTPSNSAAATQTGVLPGPQVAPTAVTREILLMAPMFQLNFQSADLLSSTTTTHTGSTSGASSTPTDSGSPAQQASSSGGSNGLSTGATVGIGVGAALAGILLASVAAWLWVRRRRRAQMQPPAAATSQMPELPGHGGPWDGSGPHAAYKTYSTQSPGWAPVSHEMDASYGSAATELPSGYGSMAAEMPTEPRYR